MPGSFVQKILQVNMSLAQGSFSSASGIFGVTGSGNAVTIQGLRMSAQAESVGASNGGLAGSLNLAIWGLPLSLMNQMTTFGPQIDMTGKNQIQLYAGDVGGAMTLVFSGIIYRGWVDAQQMPQVCYRLVAKPGGGYWAVKPVPPISKPGPQDVATMLQALAGQMGLQFENNGVKVKLTNPYYPGAPWSQALEIAKHANIDMTVDRGTMAIMPPGQPRSGDAVLISPQTGMVGYPMWDDQRVVVKTLFNPSVSQNGTIQIQSDITPACGKWRVYQIHYKLDCLMPRGEWFQIIEASTIGQDTTT